MFGRQTIVHRVCQALVCFLSRSMALFPLGLACAITLFTSLLLPLHSALPHSPKYIILFRVSEIPIDTFPSLSLSPWRQLYLACGPTITVYRPMSPRPCSRMLAHMMLAQTGKSRSMTADIGRSRSVDANPLGAMSSMQTLLNARPSMQRVSIANEVDANSSMQSRQNKHRVSNQCPTCI